MKLLSTSVLAAIAAFWTIALSASSQAQQTMTADKLVGAWQLISFTATTGDQVTYPLGEHPGGYIGFSPSRFWIMLIDSTRKAPAAAALTDAEAVSLMKSHVAYTAKYAVDPAQTPMELK